MGLWILVEFTVFIPIEPKIRKNKFFAKRLIFILFLRTINKIRFSLFINSKNFKFL